MLRYSPGRRSLFAFMLATMTTVTACSDTLTAPAEETLEGPRVTLFRTDSASYTLLAGDGGFRGMIQARLFNNTGSDIYISNCKGATGPSLEKWIDGRWQMVWWQTTPACASSPIVVPDGATWDASIDFFAGYPGGRVSPQLNVDDVPGTYRAVWFGLAKSHSDLLPLLKQLPLEQRISNPFTLGVTPR